MAERAEEPESEAAGAGAPDLSAAAALAVGLKRARAKGSAGPDARLDAFLDKQGALVDLQMEHLHEQRQILLSRLRLGRWKDRVSLALQGMTALVGVAVVILIGVMAWQAHEDHGLVIDAFSVPPDMAQSGLTGQVAASRFLDKLVALQAATARSDRPPASFQNSWGDEIKVEIPDTGLTFGEFEKLLRDRLGHVTHVSGDVVRTADGIAVTARVGQEPTRTFTGPVGSYDDLARQAAEAVYRTNQPYRFAEYLEDHGRVDEAFAVISDLAANGPRSERGWAYALWSLMDVNDHGDLPAAELHAQAGRGFTAGSDLADGISTVNAAVWSGHEEVNLVTSRRIDAEAQTRLPDTSQVFYADTLLLARAWRLFSELDYAAAAASWMNTADKDPASHFSSSMLDRAMAATSFALDHDLAAARRTIGATSAGEETSYMATVAVGAFPALPSYWMAVERGDWRAALADVQAADAWLQARKAAKPIYGLMQRSWIWPLEALAMARTGDGPGALALIGTTPLDCYLCLRVRGQIAAPAKDWPRADRWFAEAARQSPSAGGAFTDWGRMLLAKGDPDGAVAKLALAHAKAPRFADPLELWGEALMKKGDHAGAAALFRQADALAPRWGRNHLMWGEALMLEGRYREARAQYEAAEGLDLTRPDRAALDVLLARTAKGPLHG